MYHRMCSHPRGCRKHLRPTSSRCVSLAPIILVPAQQPVPLRSLVQLSTVEARIASNQMRLRYPTLSCDKTVLLRLSRRSEFHRCNVETCRHTRRSISQRRPHSPCRVDTYNSSSQTSPPSPQHPQPTGTRPPTTLQKKRTRSTLWRTQRSPLQIIPRGHSHRVPTNGTNWSYSDLKNSAPASANAAPARYVPHVARN
jgi:hypothetical protein